jgi:hypothetical protein
MRIDRNTYLLLILFFHALHVGIIAQPAKASLERQRGLYVVFEGSRISVYSSEFDGSDAQLVISEPTDIGNARPFNAIRLKISPDGRSLLYMIQQKNGWSPVYFIRSDGSGKKRLLDKSIDFYWTPRGEAVVYSLSPKRRGEEELSPWAPGNDWYSLDLRTGKSEFIADSDKNFYYLASWKDRDTAIFGSSSLFSAWLYIYDLPKRSIIGKSEVTKDGRQLVEVGANKSGTRRIGIVWPENAGIEWSCNIIELNTVWRIERSVVSAPNFQCENVAWNGDDEIFYNKSTGPNGKIDTSLTSKSGYYMLLSVFRYDFKKGKESPVIRSSGKEVYRLENVIAGRGIVISNESVSRRPRYILEFRNLDGSNPRIIRESDREMWFVGPIT